MSGDAYPGVGDSERGEAADRAPRVLSVGHINWDVTMHVPDLPEPDGEVVIDRLTQSGGGSAANVAASLAALDAPTAIYGSVGGDEAGAMALRELERAGVDPSHVLVDARETTSVKYLVVDATGEVMMFSNEGANEAFTAAELDPSVFRTLDHLHLTSQDPETAERLADSAGDRGVPVSFDPGRRVGDREFDSILGSTDLLFVNEREARLVERDGPISTESPTDYVAIVKLGRGGAVVRTPEGSVSHEGFAVEAIDTTGAGDAFAAGFVAALLDDETRSTGDDEGISYDPATYERPLIVGNACGALAAGTETARVDISWTDVEALIEAQDGGLRS